MGIKSDRPYSLREDNVASEQAEASSVNNSASNLQMRILIELQVQTMLIAQAFESTESVRKLRQDVADSIT